MAAQGRNLFQVTVVDEKKRAGGAGLTSDGKLNFHPEVGGNLKEFLPEGEAWSLMDYVKSVVFQRLGGIDREPSYNEERQRELKRRASRYGIDFFGYPTLHVHTDQLPKVVENIRAKLEEAGVELRLGVRAGGLAVEGGRVRAVETTEGEIPCDYVVLAPGRWGFQWFKAVCDEHGLKPVPNPIDIGVRVEVPSSIMEAVVEDCECVDPKFRMYPRTYDDYVRTFCVCYNGKVILDRYGDAMFGVNGHTISNDASDNTNFALLVRISLTEPLEDTTDYGYRLVQLANRLGGGKPLIQRLGDLKKGRRSTWEKVEKSYVEATLKNVTPGDISMALTHRVVTDLLEALEMLDRVVSGINSDQTLLYAPEAKFYAIRPETDRSLRTRVPNLYVAGDGAGVSRGITIAAATGIIAARGIAESVRY